MAERKKPKTGTYGASTGYEADLWRMAVIEHDNRVLRDVLPRDST